MSSSPVVPSPDRTSSPLALTVSVAAAVLLAAAIFGFFYAWVCSTMWGLDDADPRVAIAAMQAMNASVRNAIFVPAFFLTPAALVLAAWLCRRSRRAPAGRFFGAAALVYLLGGLLLTMAVNVPMNEALAMVEIPAEPAEAQRVWDAYSGRWQIWNIVRTAASGLAVLLATAGVASAARAR